MSSPLAAHLEAVAALPRSQEKAISRFAHSHKGRIKGGVLLNFFLKLTVYFFLLGSLDSLT